MATSGESQLRAPFEPKTSVSDSQKFHIERTHDAWVAAGRRLAGAAGIVLLFLLVGTAIAATEPSERTKIPVVGLELRRADATAVSALLAAASIFRLAALNLYERLLWLKLDELLQGARWHRSTWSLEHPSMFSLLPRLADLEGGSRWIVAATVGLYLSLAFVSPVVLLGYVWMTECAKLNPFWWLLCGFTFLFLIATLALIGLTPRHHGERDATLERLDSQ